MSLGANIKQRAGLPSYESWLSVFGVVLGKAIGRALTGASYAIGVFAVAELWGVI